MIATSAIRDTTVYGEFDLAYSEGIRARNNSLPKDCNPYESVPEQGIKATGWRAGWALMDEVIQGKKRRRS
jgi:hypothetical protein